MMNFHSMNNLGVLLFESISETSVTIWQKLAENAITGFFTMMGIAFAAWLAYRFALGQKKKEIFIGLEQIKYKRKLEALEGCWKLLAYTTDTENPQVILTWEKEKGGNAKTYYFHPSRAEKFITDLAAFHYTNGLGIYMPKNIKELLFEYRSIVYGLLLKEKNNTEEGIKINNAEVATRMVQIHQLLITELKNETEVIDKIGLKK